MSILNFTPSVLPVSNKLLTLLNQHCHASMESTQSTSHAPLYPFSRQKL